jgi:lipopolysaccharide/colanic/teichoic acid biosynthesis glycosyltransferase
MALVAAAIKLDSKGPIFYSQERLGLGAHQFRLYKFRTMIPGADKEGPLITCDRDNRVTRLGRLLRKSKFDEIPQLLNVLKGEMSLVGPRPEVRRYVELFPNHYGTILSVRPGLTDLASLAYINEEALLAAATEPEEDYRNKILPEKIRLAKVYVNNRSLRLDLQIIGKTLLAVVRWKK